MIEKRFSFLMNLSSARPTQRVWRRKHERYYQDCINFTMKKKTTTCSSLGTLSNNGMSSLKMLSGNWNSQHYHDKILQDILLQCQCLAYPNKDNIFQQDNAPCHNSISTRRYSADAGVRLLDWPGNSPDLSPIENIWNLIKKRTGKLPLTKDSGLIFREYGLAPEKK